MGKTWIILIAISLFLIITFIFWKLTNGRFKKEFGKKRRKLWGQRTFYWEGVIGISNINVCRNNFKEKSTDN